MRDKIIAQITQPTEHESVNVQLARLLQSLTNTLETDLLGLLLHGSLATSGFDPAVSDIDLLVVVQHEPSQAACAALAKDILAISGSPHPVELSIVRESDLRPWTHPCRYWFCYGEDHRSQFEAGDWRPRQTHDEDLAMHFTIARDRGIDLTGKYPVELLPEVPRIDYLSAIRSDFGWAKDQGEERDPYLIANACRTLAYLDGGDLLSKSEGLLWHRRKSEPTSEVIDIAIAALDSEIAAASRAD